MLTIIMAREVNDKNVILLRNMISEHHKLYLNLFNDTIKPKFHFILHYPQIMQEIGPLKYMSSMRFEAKHKQLKQIANAITSRQNPPYTLSIKHQLKLNYRFMLNEGFEKHVEWGKILHDNLTNIDCYNNFRSILPVASFDNYKCVSWVKVLGTLYKPKMVIVINKNNCIFGSIQYILRNELCKIFFLYKEVQAIEFSTHLYAYEVTETDSWKFISHSKLETYKACNIHSIGGKNYIPELYT